MEQEHEDVLASSKHVCKVCSRRFGCGRALGGHMRIHGSASASQFNAAQDEDYVINRRRGSETQSRNNTLVPTSGKQEEEEEEAAEAEAEEEEEEASCGGDRVNDLSKNSNPMYDLRPNRKRSWRYADVDYSFLVPASASASASADFGSKFGASTSFQICEECGEEFPSWKTLIRHMRCHYKNKAEEEEEEEEQSNSDDDDGKEREQNEFSDSESDTETVRLRGGPHSPEINPERIIKGKRSKRPRQKRPSSEEAVPVAFAPSSEVEYMADCLVMLASSGESWEPGKHSFDRDVECSTSGAKRDFMHGPAPVIRKRKRRTSPSNSATGNVHAHSASGKLPLPLPPKKTKYECKTCKKIFQSFQALGGHRASHNKFKGCSAKQEEEENEENEENENDNLEEEIITSDEDLSKDLAKSAPPKKKKPRDSCDKEKESIADNKGNVCSKFFESGQVLGEYWLASSTISSTKESPSPWLDLNLPAPDDESPPNKWLHSNQKQGLYSISTLVDGDDESSDRDGLVTGEGVASRNIAALPQSLQA